MQDVLMGHDAFAVAEDQSSKILKALESHKK